MKILLKDINNQGKRADDHSAFTINGEEIHWKPWSSGTKFAGYVI